MFLSMVIPGPSSPGRNIDVCLRPLIDELTQLWSSRSLTYNISISQLMEWFLVGARMES